MVSGDTATISAQPLPVLEAPVVEQSLPAAAPKAPPPVVPQVLTMEMGEVGAGLLASSAPVTASYSSNEGASNNTVGWSGQATPDAYLHKAHLPQIHKGLQFTEQVMPGFQAKMDQLLHTPDPSLQGRLDAIVSEQNGLLSSKGRLLATPDNRLSPGEIKQKSELMARVDKLAAAYVAAEKELAAKTAANQKQAEQLANAFLGKLRKDGRSEDVRDRVKLDSAAAAQLKKDGIAEDSLRNWVNEFHHQTGLPAPRQLKFTFTDDRPCYTRGNDSVNIGAKIGKRLTLHEVAHRVEYEFPEISVANKNWVQARSRNAGCSDEPAKLKDLAPKGKYADTEIALEDHFVDPYVGKVYPDLATEVLSMGLERFSSSQELVKLYSGDPEHFFLTMGALDTMRSKSKW